MNEVSQLVNKLRSTIIDLEDENSVLADKNKRLDRKIQEILAEGGAIPSYFRSPASSERSSLTSRGETDSLIMAVEQLKKKLSEERKNREE